MDQLDLFSGENFDSRAYWPKPQPALQQAPLSGRGCEFLVFAWKCGRRYAPKANCLHPGRAYRINHLPISVCRFHAAHLARHRDIEVMPDRDAVAAATGH